MLSISFFIFLKHFFSDCDRHTCSLQKKKEKEKTKENEENKNVLLPPRA